MNGERNHRLAIGLLVSGLICVAFGAVALGNFASTPSGDLAVSSIPWTVDMLLTAGALLLLGLEFAYARRRRLAPAGTSHAGPRSRQNLAALTARRPRPTIPGAFRG